MEATKKVPFFKKIKYSMFNFDEYQNFATEKTRKAIAYILKIVGILSLILAVITTYKMLNDIKEVIRNDIPEFEIKDNELILYNESGTFNYENEYGYYIDIDANRTEPDEEFDSNKYATYLIFLKDKFIMGQNDEKRIIEYKNLDLSDFTKENVISSISGQYTMLTIIVMFFSMFIIYFVQIMLDIFLLSIIGIIVNKIIRTKFKYKELFNISVYAVTLSVILYFIYLITNILTGFTISYFRIAYNTINYIYLITAMLTIRSEIIKQQIEVEKTIKVQEKIKEEQKEDDNEKKEQKKKKDNKKDKEDKKENEQGNLENEDPEGSKA